MIIEDMNRKAVLNAALAQIDKQFGKGTVMRLDAEAQPVATTPTGSVGLDLALGCGGYPRGRIIEIYGPEASGKTTLTLHAMAEMQARGGVAAFVDAEHALDPIYARKLGVRLEDLLLSQPDNGEQALDVVEALVRSSAVDMIVVDSVAALVPRDEIEGGMADAQVGLQARMMSKAMRKLTHVVSESNTTLIFINQVRQKIGVTYGPTEVTTGGNALKFYASVRLDIRKVSSIKKEDQVVGAHTRVRIVKNKLAPPLQQVEFDIMFGRGISRVAELVDLASDQGVIERSGSWYSFAETRLGQGRESAITHLESNPALAQEIRGALACRPLRQSAIAEA